MFDTDEVLDTSDVIGGALDDAAAAGVSEGGFLSGLAGGGGGMLAGLMGGGGFTGGAAGPSSSDGSRQEAGIDHSGWNVVFGGGNIASERKQSAALEPTMQYVMLGAGFLLLWRYLKKK